MKKKIVLKYSSILFVGSPFAFCSVALFLLSTYFLLHVLVDSHGVLQHLYEVLFHSRSGRQFDHAMLDTKGWTNHGKLLKQINDEFLS